METLSRPSVSKQNPERTFFIVDRSRLKSEGDELRDAVVVYVPDGDIKKPVSEQRCSQLIGISILMYNFTSKLPKFIQLKSQGFAIRSLGDTSYIMGLQSKYDEPKTSVIQYLNRIHDFFMFCYFSVNHVMEMSRGDWEIFTIQMTTIFQSILDFAFRRSHTLPSMFNPIPYISLDGERGGTSLFLQAHRLLRSVQQKKSVIGGCLFYNGELLCSQLPPDIAEKLLFVAGGGVELDNLSVLDDLQTPESVWVIEVYLTPEELAILYQIQRPHNSLSSFYSSLVPNPRLTTSVFLQEKASTSSTSSVRTKKQDLAPLYRADSGGSADFVTISYGSDSSVSQREQVSLLKRPRNIRRLSNSYEEVQNQGAPTYNNLFSSEEAPPPLPPKPGPPPIPERNTIRKRPVPPPRTSSTHQRTSKEEGSAVSGGDNNADILNDSEPTTAPVVVPTSIPQSQWMYGQDDVSSPVSPGVFGTPSSSIVGSALAEVTKPRADSDTSDRFGTPPCSSPVPDSKNLSLSTTTSDPLFLTPLVTSPTDDNRSLQSQSSSIEQQQHQSDSNVPPTFDIYADPVDRPAEDPVVIEKSQASGITLDDLQQMQARDKPRSWSNNSTDETRKVSHISNTSVVSDASGSLVITKAISEKGPSCTGSSLQGESINLSDVDTEFEQELEKQQQHSTDSMKDNSSVPQVDSNEAIVDGYQNDGSFDEEEEDEENQSIQSTSPAPHEITGSASESEDQLTAMNINFVQSMKRPRAESWIGIQPLTGKTDKDEPMTQRAISLERKTIYIQKCVNTVIVVVADSDLPKNHELLRNLWKSMLNHLLHINNSVEACVMEAEALYVAGDAMRSDGPKTYQAMYSGLTGNCEVSSFTAPYQFRHAARRAHQEYLVNPSLKQVSLCKEYCRMYCQNIMGRESFLHATRSSVADSLMVHAVLERQARSLRRQRGLSNVDYHDTPNLSFL